MVDGSNESLYHANEEFDPNLCTGVPLQKSLEIVDVVLPPHESSRIPAYQDVEPNNQRCYHVEEHDRIMTDGES